LQALREVVRHLAELPEDGRVLQFTRLIVSHNPDRGRPATRWGAGAVVPARAGVLEKQDWSTKFEMRTPRYTTQVSELPVAVA